MRHHELTVAAFTRAQAKRPDTLGVVLVGSVARGEERPSSDVDVYLVVTDAAYDAAAAAGSVAWVSRDGVAYDGGYVDVKLASPAYLQRAVAEADDPTRASLVGARVTLDRMGGLADLLSAITVLPETTWTERVRSYRAQVELYGGYFLRQAAERRDEFLLHHAAVHACLAAGRLALARERQLFRGQKYLHADLASLQALPAGFLVQWQHLLTDPTPSASDALRATLDRWLGGRPGLDETLGRFITDNELGWLTGRRPPEFW